MSDDAPTVEAAREQLAREIERDFDYAAINQRIDALITAVRSDALRGSATKDDLLDQIECCLLNGSEAALGQALLLVDRAKLALRGSADPLTAKQVEVHHEAQVAHGGAISQPPLPSPAPPSTPRQET